MTGPRPSAPPTRLIARAVLHGPAGAPEVVRAAIDLTGATITAVHHLAAGAPPPPGGPDTVEVLGDDLLVSPAFVDAHTHLALSALRGLSLPEEADSNLVESFFFRLESYMHKDDVRAFVRMGAYEALLSGTALVWDHYYHADAVIGGLLDVGLPAVVAPTLQDQDGPGVAQQDAALAATIAVADDPRLAAQGIFSAFGPHATDTVSDALFRRVAELAERHDLPVHVHVAQSLDELERVHARHGCSPVALLERTGVIAAAPRTLLIHNIFVTDAELRRLPGDRVAMGLCPHSKEIFAYRPDIRAWNQADLPWFVATDCAASNDALNVQRDLRAAIGMRTAGVTWSVPRRRFSQTGAVVDARAAWAERAGERAETTWLADPGFVTDRIWRVPGALHPAFTAGVIAPGALANLAVWDLSHPAFWPARAPIRALAMSDTTGALHNVMAAGRWVGVHGDYARSVVGTDAYREARAEANARLAALERRVAG